MQAGMVTTAYIIAAVLFILALAGLSQQESAKRGIWYGIVGMGIALAATLLGPKVMSLRTGLTYILIAMLIGGAIGIYLAKRVEMTEMPELVAMLHSFVGLAAVF
ncbi:MAG: NAD(P) transhydrogenase subunit beta, partial [Oceanospirillaceae bacterium]|nr:NAD(P) transhydrogenase subunit beta [Oceanospirillaceae bacterium]